MTKYQLFPSLDPATESALRSSIRQYGVVYAVIKDEDGNIIDGHHRARIAEELGIECPVQVQPNVSAADLALDLNAARRGGNVDMRRKMVADLRAEGHSLRSIAGAVGTSLGSVQRDLGTVSAATVPDRVVGLDGKSRPSTRPSSAEVAVALVDAEPERTLSDAIPEADAIVGTTDDPAQGVTEAVESRRVPQAVPKKSADGVPPHPATYPQAVLDIFAEYVVLHHLNWESCPVVLDPFGGIGSIHKLREMVKTCVVGPYDDGHEYCHTVAVELEPEWAAAHPQTICGDSRGLDDLLGDYRFDVIATSPAYGNRLADDYRASDPHARRSYSIDLGRSLTEGSGASMHFDTDGEYEDLHMRVWWQCVSRLQPGGLFLLNCKDFQRASEVMPVTGWHVGKLSDLGLVVVDIRTLPAAGLPFTTAKPLSELVVVFRKPFVKAVMDDC